MENLELVGKAKGEWSKAGDGAPVNLIIIFLSRMHAQDRRGQAGKAATSKGKKRAKGKGCKAIGNYVQYIIVEFRWGWVGTGWDGTHGGGGGGWPSQQQASNPVRPCICICLQCNYRKTKRLSCIWRVAKRCLAPKSTRLMSHPKGTQGRANVWTGGRRRGSRFAKSFKPERRVTSR